MERTRGLVMAAVVFAIDLSGHSFEIYSFGLYVWSSFVKVKRYVCEYMRFVGRIIDAVEDEKSDNMVTSRDQATW